ncbi:MAG TPA: hypothetical protein VN783_01880 [Thermoanaerobaculia bacterium]|nr:hypothetical protein [Thermoanaerobaculia bacterium]
MTARGKVLLLALCEAGVLLAWAGYHERLWATAPTFRIALRPVDPHDVLRGRYFILNPKDGSFAGRTADSGPLLSDAALARFLGRETAYHGRARIGFCPRGAIERICALARPGGPPTGPAEHWVAGQVRIWYAKGPDESSRGYTGSIDLGLDSFFLPERAKLPAPENAPGWELEVVYRPDLPPLPKRLWFGGRPVDLR